jgi:hypothetical protein
MSNQTNNNLVVIVDNVGRTILGKQKSLDERGLTLENAAVLYVASDEESKSRLTVQMVPLFFREFLANKESVVTAHYNPGQFVLLGIEAFDSRMLTQYTQTFARVVPTPNIPVNPEPQTQEANIVNLFDDKK